MLLTIKNNSISIGNRCELCGTSVAKKLILRRNTYGNGFKLVCRKHAGLTKAFKA